MAMNYGLLYQSANYSKNPHPIIYHCLGKLFGIPDLGIYFMAYAYGKWIDDKVDNSSLDRADSLRLLDRQVKIVQGSLLPQNTPEKIGYFLGKYFKTKRGQTMGPCFFEFLSALRFDEDRKFKVLMSSDLERRIYEFGTSYITFCQRILAPTETLDKALIQHINKGYIKLDMILDFEEDLLIGYCNIPFERLINLIPNPSEIFSIEFSRIKDAIAPFVHESIIEIYQSIDEILPMIAEIRSFSLRFFLMKMYKKRVSKLNKLEQVWGH